MKKTNQHAAYDSTLKKLSTECNKYINTILTQRIQMAYSLLRESYTRKRLVAMKNYISNKLSTVLNYYESINCCEYVFVFTGKS